MDMFNLPQTEIVDGSDDEHPLLLPGLSADDFRVYVKAALPR
jgi:hypothetical protein